MGESSRVISLFTSQRGKLKAVAKGVKKSAIKKGGALELFCHIQGVVYLKENVELGTIGSIELVESYAHLADNPSSFGFASAYCEILDKLTTIDQPVEGLFELTEEFFGQMAKHGPEASAILFWAAFIKMLTILGYQPHLFECVACGRKNEGKAAFYDAQKGGIICSKDTLEHVEYGKLSASGLAILQQSLINPLSAMAKIEPSDKNLAEIEDFIISFAVYHTGLRRDLKSFKFLAQLK